MSPASTFDSDNEYLRMFQHDFKGMLSNGAHVTIGSDWSHGLEISMLRNMAGVAKTIGSEKVLEMITLAGAVATGRDQVTRTPFASHFDDEETLTVSM
jgi:cytosine/adenosine deaminase-related metal-dependent hydrolase